jgi:hypothetical protein
MMGSAGRTRQGTRQQNEKQIAPSQPVYPNIYQLDNAYNH